MIRKDKRAETKYNTVAINITTKPTFIVGLCPGYQRGTQRTLNVWEGNKSGDLLRQAIDGINNLYLTNTFNVYTPNDPTTELLDAGKAELAADIERLQPAKIICCGQAAYKTVREVLGTNPRDVIVKSIKHPSYVIRFGENKKEWREELQHDINN